MGRSAVSSASINRRSQSTDGKRSAERRMSIIPIPTSRQAARSAA